MPDSATLPRTTTIDVRARRAERLLGCVALFGVGCAAVLLYPDSAALASAVLVIGGTAVSVGLWLQGWFGGASRLTTLSWLPDGRWLLSDKRHTDVLAALRSDSRVGSHWVWLRWELPSSRPRRRSMLLLDGDLAAPDLRRLLVRLRLLSQHPASRAESPGP